MTDDETVTITFTKQQLAWLNHAVQELPMRLALPLVQFLNAQLSEQLPDAQPEQPPAATLQ